MPLDYIKKESEYSPPSRTEIKEIKRFNKKFQGLMIGHYSPKEPPKFFKKVSAKEDKRNKRTIKTLRERILSG